MSEEENQTTEEQPEDAAAAGPVAADAPSGEPEGSPEDATATPPAEEEASADDDVSAEEAPAEEASAQDEAPAEQEAPAEEEAPAEQEAPAEEEAPAPAAKAPAGDGEAPAELGPKEKRKLARSTFTGEAGPERSADDRAAERIERRRKAKEARRRVRVRARTKKEPGTGTPPAEREPGARKVRQGTVVSSRADKTITVEIQLARRHPSYEKIVRTSRKLHAHDEANEASEGDIVRVVETRPLSKTKRWRLAEIVERAPSR